MKKQVPAFRFIHVVLLKKLSGAFMHLHLVSWGEWPGYQKRGNGQGIRKAC